MGHGIPSGLLFSAILLFFLNSSYFGSLNLPPGLLSPETYTLYCHSATVGDAPRVKSRTDLGCGGCSLIALVIIFGRIVKAAPSQQNPKSSKFKAENLRLAHSFLGHRFLKWDHRPKGEYFSKHWPSFPEMLNLFMHPCAKHEDTSFLELRVGSGMITFNCQCVKHVGCINHTSLSPKGRILLLVFTGTRVSSLVNIYSRAIYLESPYMLPSGPRDQLLVQESTPARSPNWRTSVSFVKFECGL